MTKKFANVFEFLAEAERLGREIEIRYPASGTWHKLNILEGSRVGGIRQLFDQGNLRLKPKLKTVEGYVMLTRGTSATSAHLPFYADNPFVYADKECSPARRTEGDIIAKITFEVEE